MRERLLPLSLIATPNLPEARILAELPEGTADECAEKLLPFVKHLLITGGHGDETEIHNRLYSRDGHRDTFTCQRLPGSYHGSGCTLASTLAGRLAIGEELVSGLAPLLNKDSRVLIPRSKNARIYVVEELSKICPVDEVQSYETIREDHATVDPLAMLENKEIDYITFTSSTTVEFFVEKMTAFEMVYYEYEEFIKDV